MFYDEDFYNEPSEFDMKVDEFKQDLLKSVKEEYANEMERLEKENRELQNVKLNFEQIKRNYESKEIDLERAKEKAKQEARRERLDKLMDDYKIVLYRASAKSERKNKCDRCDDNRRIYYKTPLGKDAYESCDCSKGKLTYSPKENIIYEFRINRDNNELLAWYQYDDEYGSMRYSTKADSFYKKGMKYEDVNRYNTFFKDKEDCQKYCDHLNNEEN
ncbi:hypothetical protein [Aquibacillus saliphilus]|uniref:hypothetical protein n=1 Tax=Aquibacillus saliphilus TaxID=1909422 RepID=UPI001CF02A1A|nr:hypothetical protein [Aquibacillus saliphilus]